jgi:3-hydroxyacyl-CoA dehydrogenase
MIVSGNPMTPPEQLKGTALIDEIIEGDFLAGRSCFRREGPSPRSGPMKRLRDLKVSHPSAEAFLAFAKTSVQAVAKNFPRRPSA